MRRENRLADLNKRLADRRVTVTFDQKAKEWAAEKRYDPVFGARLLKRFLQRNIEPSSSARSFQESFRRARR